MAIFDIQMAIFRRVMWQLLTFDLCPVTDVKSSHSLARVHAPEVDGGADPGGLVQSGRLETSADRQQVKFVACVTWGEGDADRIWLTQTTRYLDSSISRVLKLYNHNRVSSWSSGKLPFKCRKIARKLPFFL